MVNNRSIGGYFGLETMAVNSGYHPTAIALNTGRNALEYILKVMKVSKIYLPYFTCEVLLEPFKKLQISFEFYNINEQLEPIFDFSVMKSQDFFLYTNYFGLKDNYIKKLSFECENLIVDNAQAFYSKPFNRKPTLYSARKFFGVADGAYLYCDTKLEQIFEKDISYKRMCHLLIRNDISAEAGYKSFVANDKSLINQPIRTMSSLTTSILGMIDYDAVAKKRIENYRFLDQALKESNKLNLQLVVDSVPMVYPYWSEDLKLRERLLFNKVYTASYWPNVKQWCFESSLEYKLTTEVVYLPIDQRYNFNDLKKILKYV